MNSILVGLSSPSATNSTPSEPSFNLGKDGCCCCSSESTSPSESCSSWAYVENGIVEENIAPTIAVTAKMASGDRKILYVRILASGLEVMLKLTVFKVFMRY